MPSGLTGPTEQKAPGMEPPRVKPEPVTVTDVECVPEVGERTILELTLNVVVDVTAVPDTTGVIVMVYVPYIDPTPTLNEAVTTPVVPASEHAGLAMLSA